ncbi:MAG: Methyltransferase type 11, partial [Candidatus Curtissbacteria bacterium GW2011_GWA1_40_24]
MTNYFSSNYNDKSRWMSYWYQAREVVNFNPGNVLVVGKGDGLISEYFKLIGIKTTTLDIDKSLNPNVVASVLNMPFSDNEFDAVLCAQVLEHLPFEDFNKALLEIKRVTRSSTVISLPHFGPAIRIFLKIPFLPELKLSLRLPYPIKHRFKGEHYWEIGKRNYPLKLIKSEMIKSG